MTPADSPTALAIEMNCDLRAVADMCREARDFFANSGLAPAQIDAWELVLTEAANNAVAHCGPDARSLPVRVELVVGGDWAEARVTDHTPGFDYPDNPELPPPDSEAGRGLFLIRKLTDEVRYRPGPQENYLVLRKRRSNAA